MLAFNRMHCLEPLIAAASIRITIAAKCANRSVPCWFWTCMPQMLASCTAALPQPLNCASSPGLLSKQETPANKTLRCASALGCVAKTHTVEHRVHRQTHPLENNVTTFVCDVRE